MKEFKCDTYQPGCRLICYNRYLPLSPLRFWSYEILFTSIPAILFSFVASRQTLHYKQLSRLEEDEEKENKSLQNDSSMQRIYLRQRSKFSRRMGVSKPDDVSRKVGKKTKRMLEDKKNELEKEIILTPRIKQCYGFGCH